MVEHHRQEDQIDRSTGCVQRLAGALAKHDIAGIFLARFGEHLLRRINPGDARRKGRRESRAEPPRAAAEVDDLLDLRRRHVRSQTVEPQAHGTVQQCTRSVVVRRKLGLVVVHPFRVN